jgi:hypothetical protein
MQKFCPHCGSPVKETMLFCKNCGKSLEEEGIPEAVPEKAKSFRSRKAGRKEPYRLIALVCVVLLVAGFGYLFSQNTLSVQSDPVGAGVYLDSEFRGVTPSVIHYLLPGKYHLEFRHEGYPSWQRNITVSLGQAETVTADLSDNLIPEVKVACISDEMIQNKTGPSTCIYKREYAVIISGTAVRPHPKENSEVTIAVYPQGSVSPLKTQSVGIRADYTYNLTLDGTTLPSGDYQLVASLPSGQKSAVFFTVESPDDTNIRILRKIVEDYHNIHSYSLIDYFICADMAQDVWNIVDTRGMRAVLVAGNIQKPDAGWKEYDHAWVLVEAARGQWVALETTGGFLVFKKDNPNYFRGIFFENPKDLKTNMDLSRDYNNEIYRFSTLASQYNAKVSAYNTERDYYHSLTDSYNKQYVGQNLTFAEYQESLGAKSTIEAEQLKLVQLKAELDQLTVTYNNEKQIMDNITAQMDELAAKGVRLMNS